MTEDNRKAVADIIDYSDEEIDESQLENRLEAVLTEQLDDLDICLHLITPDPEEP